MGMTSVPGPLGGSVAAPGGLAPASALPGTPALLAPALAALLGSEDTLFRDPFADFIPSGR